MTSNPNVTIAANEALLGATRPAATARYCQAPKVQGRRCGWHCAHLDDRQQPERSRRRWSVFRRYADELRDVGYRLVQGCRTTSADRRDAQWRQHRRAGRAFFGNGNSASPGPQWLTA
ncbi:MAG: hypothetical protein EOO77_25630 [Oxalobacteraceae bacterium]|nr:MAG: hypothetical protein EOO77_25630 [Oxalobacteraceae bacterium]